MQHTLLEKIKRILNNKPYPTFIGWDSFAELREKRKLREQGKLKESFWKPDDWDDFGSPDIKAIHLNPEEMGHTDPLTPDEEYATHLFTSGADIAECENAGGYSDLTGKPFEPHHLKNVPALGSKSLNAFISGKKTTTNLGTLKKVLHHVELLCNAIRPGRTNKRPIILYSGIPHDLGNMFLNEEPNTEHYTNRFTSTSTEMATPYSFAAEYKKPKGEYEHLLKITAPPNSAMSVAKHSFMVSENEALLPPGSHLTYHSSELIPPTGRFSAYYLHHVSIDPSKRLPTEHILDSIKKAHENILKNKE